MRVTRTSSHGSICRTRREPDICRTRKRFRRKNFPVKIQIHLSDSGSSTNEASSKKGKRKTFSPNRWPILRDLIFMGCREVINCSVIARYEAIQCFIFRLHFAKNRYNPLIQNICSRSSVGLERLPAKEEVTGSSPVGCTIWKIKSSFERMGFLFWLFISFSYNSAYFLIFGFSTFWNYYLLFFLPSRGIYNYYLAYVTLTHCCRHQRKMRQGKG